MKKLRANLYTKLIPLAPTRQETNAERMKRLKSTADATGRHFLHVYLEDERQRKGNQG
jgi:hypothetical protein